MKITLQPNKKEELEKFVKPHLMPNVKTESSSGIVNTSD